MTSKLLWLLLVMLLSISTFGLWMCCLIIICVSACLLGGFIVTCTEKNLRFLVNLDASSRASGREGWPFFGIPKVVLKMNRSPVASKLDQRLTGSNEIDNQLREILSYIVRDFIQSWYQDLSLHTEFIQRFNDICKSLINNFSKSSKEVNWISFFTQRVVEDFTSHLRLFRHTEMAFRKKQRENPESFLTLESVFFEKEIECEKEICREDVCSCPDKEKEYLQSICDVLLYLLLPPEDFNNTILKHIFREVLSSSVLEPLLSQFSDPDVINQNLIWLCKDHVVTSKILLAILRRTDNIDELSAFLQISKHELKVQNSKDSGDKDEMKKYIKSISFVQNIARIRYERIKGHSKNSEVDSAEFYLDFDSTDAPMFDKTEKLVSLPFDVILNNNIALHYFTQYLVNIDAEGYVFFYHNIEGFRTTVEMIRNENSKHSDGELSSTEKLRSLAVELYATYFGPDAISKINMDENILRKFSSRLKTETITESFFDELQEKVYEILENEHYLNGFKDSKMYVKLLAELDLLHDLSPNSDLDSLSSSKSEEEEKFNCDTVVPTDEEMLNELLTAEIQTSLDFPEMSSGPISDENKEVGVLFAEVHSTGITHHGGRTFAVYAISVSHYRADESEEKWFVVRRYSEFYDFHESVTSKFPLLASFNFPSKKPFNNLTRQLMEKRCHMLNEFMQFLLAPDILGTCDGLKLMVYNFLQPNMTEKAKKSFVRSVSTFVNPIKSSVKTVGQFARMVPDTFSELKVGFFKTFFKNNEVDFVNEIKPMFLKDNRTDDIPFRIMLLLMDEVFNLRNKDLWFRRRIMALLRQIIKTMQGGAINRKIRDYVQGMTSASQIAEWLKLLSKSIWPDGKLATETLERDYNTKMRTRMLAKMLLFAAIPDELKHIIGYETSFKGAMLIFNMFQYPSLNRRLLLVLFESFLKILFPHNQIPNLIKKLHSQSARLVTSTSASMDDLNNYEVVPKESKKTSDITSPSPEVVQKSLDIPKTKSEIKDESKVKARKKEPKSNFFLECLPQSSFLSSPKPSKKRKKSVETARFYTDSLNEEDTVILPIGR